MRRIKVSFFIYIYLIPLGNSFMITPLSAETSLSPPITVVAPVKIVPDAAFTAFQKGEYKLAYKEAMARLEKNSSDAAAMTLLGELYVNGLGVIPDLVKAKEYFQYAAKRGDTNAMTTLGMMALAGKGMDKDISLAKAYFEKAAEKGNPLACHQLSLILFRSKLFSDEKRAVSLLKTAADAGIVSAQHDLGVAYLHGRGVLFSDEEAAQWFEKAARWGYTSSEVEYAILLFNGQGVNKNEALAARYFLRAAYKGNAIAQNRIARLYALGRGVSKNLTEAAAWHQVASMKGITDPKLNGDLRNLTNDEIEMANRLALERLYLN